MRILFFCRKMPDLCGAFFHDIDLAIELQNRGHQVAFLTILVPAEGYNGGTYRGFRFMHYTAASSVLDTADIMITPHSPILPEVRKINSRGYNRPIIATCHFDGNYTAVATTPARASWAEMLFFVNSVMEFNYRKHIVPWPSQIQRTEMVRPILHKNKILIEEPFQGDCITLINANLNKGQKAFLDMAKKMPDTKFLGVLPYYGEREVAAATPNVEWIGFDDDIRNILRRTRILVMPSYYESFGRVGVEAMANGIPVLYSKPVRNNQYENASTEGLQSWIHPAGIACERDNTEEWVDAIRSLEDPETYAAKSQECRDHIEAMKVFDETPRIASLVESFARQFPIVVKKTVEAAQQPNRPGEAPRLIQPAAAVPVGFANGRLRIRR
jgi:glycosyltransferase involved in cell wall biosynthesis